MESNGNPAPKKYVSKKLNILDLFNKPWTIPKNSRLNFIKQFIIPYMLVFQQLLGSSQWEMNVKTELLKVILIASDV